jgi:hypothetical protein
MNVVFRRTGERRYAVIVQIPGQPEQALNPAPGFDPHIPHDLVHYVVEAELQLRAGVFGRAASGAGTFILQREGPVDAREQARARRKQARREQARAREPEADAQMVASERLAYRADIAWRRQQGQRADPALWHEETPLTKEDAERVDRVVARLTELSPRWHALPVGGELVFEWPSLRPEVRGAECPGAPSAGA